MMERDMKKDLLTLKDLTKEQFDALFARALELKKRKKEGIVDRPLEGKSVGLLFNKPSTRTRISFETATIQLGGVSIFMNENDTQIGRSEPVKDTARVLARYIDCLVIRTFSQELVEEYASYSGVPVVNALTDMYHPCQILSDLMTVMEAKGSYDAKVAWVGDGNNVAHSWIWAASTLGFELSLACPEGFDPDAAILKEALARGAKVSVVRDPKEAVSGADIVYTDVWASMGQEVEQKAREKSFEGFIVDDALMALAKPDASFMHCLPAHRGEEVSESVMEGPQSIIWDEAENKLHMHKAILDMLINRTL